MAKQKGSKQQHRHAWLDLVSRTGLLVTEPVLCEVFPEGPEKASPYTYQRTLNEQQRWLVEPSSTARQNNWIKFILHELLELPRDGFRRESDLPSNLNIYLLDYDQSILPSSVLFTSDDEPLLGLWTVAHDQELDRVEKQKGKWRTTPNARAVRWMRETGVQFVLLTNGHVFRILHTPVGLPEVSIDFDSAEWSEDKQFVNAFITLLSKNRWFGKPLLSDLTAASRHKQTELNDQLGNQVREATEKLILALDREDFRLSGQLLKGLKTDDIYRAVVYFIMRLVFMFFAEERSLLPHGNVFFDEAYGIGHLLYQLEQEKRSNEDSYNRSCDAFPRILALIRLVFYGSSHPDLNLPAYSGELFDPQGFEAMRVFENPELQINNRQLHEILRALTFSSVKVGRHYISQRYSYINLDVEHIGYLYEGLLDHTAKRAESVPLVKIRKGTEEAFPIDEFETRTPDQLADFIKNCKGPKDRKKTIERISNPDPDDQVKLDYLTESTAQACRPYASVIQTDEVVEPHHLFFSTSASRRATGTHYTPIEYTRAMVQETLEPLVYMADHGKYEEPRRLRTPREILNLKICDPAMGSGAFLVQVVRYLADKLVDSWWDRRQQFQTAKGLYLPYAEPSTDLPEKTLIPEEREEAFELAKRLIAERCICGVDKNPLAVEMAKLSLWLVTLSRDKPFTFLDHALKSGDSLIGINSIEQIEKWDLSAQDGSEDLFSSIFRSKTQKAAELRETLERLTTDGILETHEKENLNTRAEKELEDLKVLASLLIAPEFQDGSESERNNLRGYFHTLAMQDNPNADALKGKPKDLIKDLVPFNWPLEFPEVYTRENPGFDAMVGNPPFMGGQKITGNLGQQYREYLVAYHANGKRGSADIVAYFYLRALQLLRQGGNFGLLAINTISEGDTRQTGLEQILKWGNTIYSAYPDEPWPLDAAVVTSRVHVHKGQWKGKFHRRKREVPCISAFLSSREEWSPKKLKANENMSFIGSYVLGMGFVLEEEEALELIKKDPRNREVLFPYLNGRDLNSHPEQKPSRWVINFWDWPEHKARTYTDVFKIIEEKVKPERQRRKPDGSYKLRRPLPEKWWTYGEKRPALYHAIGRGEHFEKHPVGWNDNQKNLNQVLVCSLVSKYLLYAFRPNNEVWAHRLAVFAFDDYTEYAILSSSINTAWAVKMSSTFETRMNYSPSDAFETFPFPELNSDSNESLRELGKQLDSKRKEIMLNRQIGLTALYNAFHDPVETDKELTRLRTIHKNIDTKVLESYGWSDIEMKHGFHKVPYLPSNDNIRCTICEDARLEILDRLMELNKERYKE